MVCHSGLGARFGRNRRFQLLAICGRMREPDFNVAQGANVLLL
jgi:hypothetical protein